MTIRILTILCTFSCALCAHAANLALDKLGNLALSFQRISHVEHYPGKYLPAQVVIAQGQEFTLTAPMNVQQIDYLAQTGQKLLKGDAFARLRGSEVHHFVTEYEINKDMFSLMEKRYQNNKILFNKKAINESNWLEINKAYFAAKLENEHMHHFFDLVLTFNEADESVTLGAPSEGLIILPQQTQVRMNDSIAVFVPLSAIKLKVSLPASQLNKLEFVQTDTCKINIQNVEDLALENFVYAWSETVPEACKLKIGQHIRVTPYFQTSSYQVSKDAVFDWQGENTLWVKQGQSIRSEKITLIASVDDNYIVSAPANLNDAQVLTSSVSAIQGILLGLGDE